MSKDLTLTKTGSATSISTPVHVAVLPERFDAFTDIDLPSGSERVVLDGRSVRFADRHALQSLVDARLRLLDAGGDLIVGAPSIALRVTLELTGFDVLLNIVSGAIVLGENQ